MRPSANNDGRPLAASNHSRWQCVKPTDFGAEITHIALVFLDLLGYHQHHDRIWSGNAAELSVKKYSKPLKLKRFVSFSTDVEKTVCNSGGLAGRFCLFNERLA
jgi:hypothetical protein